MNLTRWEWFLFGLAAFIAVRALVRMLVARRDYLQADLEQKLLVELRAEKAKTANQAAAAAIAGMADEMPEDQPERRAA